MDTRYKQSSPEDQLIEECSELIQALCKFKRFGDIVTDPLTGKTYHNILQCKAEIADVQFAIKLCMTKWSETE